MMQDTTKVVLALFDRISYWSDTAGESHYFGFGIECFNQAREDATGREHIQIISCQPTFCCCILVDNTASRRGKNGQDF
jgi:hypothetical protein